MIPLIEDLQSRLEDAARPGTREWWTRYLKGEARFRGVPMPEVRRVVGEWVAARDAVDGSTDAALLDLIDELLRAPDTEDKLAAMLLVREWLLDAGRLEWRDAIERWGRAFEDGAIADWNACDWFCVKVLGPLIRRDGEACGRTVAGWIDADGLWQRRASAVAFVDLVNEDDEVFTGLVDLVLANCARLVGMPERFAQTAAGWVLRELSRSEPDRVRSFLAAHRSTMSTEAARNASRYLT